MSGAKKTPLSEGAASIVAEERAKERSRVRFGCGAMLGLGASCFTVLRYFSDFEEPWLVAAFVVGITFLGGFVGARGRDEDLVDFTKWFS